MNRFIAPLALGFMMSVAGTAVARDNDQPKHAYRGIVYDGYMFNNDGCFPKARFGRTKLDLGDLETLKDTGELPGSELTISTIFPANTEPQAAKEQLEAIQLELAMAYKTIKKRPDCRP